MLPPAIVLVRPQLGENIGAVARAMFSFGLSDLRLVEPRDGWPNARAWAMASGADAILNAVTVHSSTADALADLQVVYATTGRVREMLKTRIEPRALGPRMRADHAVGRRAGVLFGGERAGLDNDDVTRANAIITIPTDPGFRSLNLAQAVVLIGYEWFVAERPAGLGIVEPEAREPAASRHDLENLFEHLEEELEAGGFFRGIAAKKPIMMRNIRNILLRGNLLEQDVRTLRGVIRALTGHRARNNQTPK